MDRISKQLVSCFIVMLIFIFIINISIDNEILKACLRLVLVSNMIAYFFGKISMPTLIPMTFGTASYMYIIMESIEKFQNTDLTMLLIMFISNIIVYLHTLHISSERK